ncbi:polycystin-2 isoform X1 [Hydra vulgaris]|uniref:polycystin-2 isoform X1 n=1 Tax=Hydra vulgaris TaxID=6087 RepID=UPI001F5E35D6|nr:polycystin-2-like [Hydra vulgaris]XP_012560626.2 polycystin-2-like [Hydra vulgaris]
MSAKKRLRSMQLSELSLRAENKNQRSNSTTVFKLEHSVNTSNDSSEPTNQNTNEATAESYFTYKSYEDYPDTSHESWGKKFCRGFRGLWKTRQTEDDCSQEMIVKTSLRELTIYLFFVLIVSIITFGMSSSTMYFFNQSLIGLFTGPNPPSIMTISTIATSNDFFEYLDKVLLNGLYTEQYYNGDNIPEIERGYVLFENKLLGLPRLRQVRVKNDSCLVHPFFKNSVYECYAPYSSGNEFKENIESFNQNGIYHSEAEISGRSFSGQVSTYGGGGYIALLNTTNDDSNSTIQNLMKMRWINRGTRAVFIDFTVYNANINLFCVITLLFEFPATGGCMASATYRSLKLLRYVTDSDYFVMGCEYIFVVFILYYLIEELLEIQKNKLSYFYDVWSIFDLLVLCIGIFCVAFNIYRTISVGKLLQDLLENQDQYANFGFLSEWQTRFNDFAAVGVFISWIKIFKFIKFNKTMSQLQSTLARGAKDIAAFAVIFMLVFLAYAQLGYLLFGCLVQDYSTILSCIYSLFRIILGDFTFSDLQNAQPTLGPIFFITFVFFVFFILFNMFVAIVNETYAEVKIEIALQKDEFQLGDYFKRGYNNMMTKLKLKKENIVNIQEALQFSDKNKDKTVDFEEWRLELKKRGHSDVEIAAVFSKYDNDGDRILNEEEISKMNKDLETQKNQLNDEIEDVTQQQATWETDIESFNDNESDDESETALEMDRAKGVQNGLIRYKEYTILARRVDRLEHNIGSIVSKLDSLFVKLETMDQAKKQRRETMKQLLDIIEKQNLPGLTETLKI